MYRLGAHTLGFSIGRGGVGVLSMLKVLVERQGRFGVLEV